MVDFRLSAGVGGPTRLRCGLPAGIRTQDLRIRSPLLYPAELRGADLLMISIISPQRLWGHRGDY